MNILIYGAGAIGCHIGYCMYVSGHAVTLVCRGKHYKQMKKTGMHIKICDNEVIQHEQTIKEDARFKILNDVNQIKDPQMDRVFITVKMGDYNEQTLKSLHPFMGQDTAVIPPCTKLPFLIKPNSSDLSRIHLTGLSLIEPPGFTDSSFAYNLSDNFMKGVLPTKSETILDFCSSNLASYSLLDLIYFNY